MKKGRIILTMVAFAFAIVSAFASHFETPPVNFYGSASGVTCTQGIELTTTNACTGTTGTQCHIVILVSGERTTVPAFTGETTPGSGVCNSIQAKKTP